jgi:5S rRNA maturation endonuclease (ribonuclease M5)
MKTPLTPSEVSVYYGNRLPKLNQRGSEWRGPCPIHDGKNPSFAVSPETGAWTCHSKCQRGGSVVDLEIALAGTDFKVAVAEVERLVGRISSKPKIVATYDYCDEKGVLLYQAVRYEPKNFKQRRPDGNGGWIWKTKDVRRVLYRLPRLEDADLVLVVEGEKDVHSLERLGYVATCNAGGAGKWRSEFADVLSGKRVIVIPDEDEPGRQHADAVVRSLRGKATDIRVIRVQIGKDITDWINAGATKDMIDAAIAAADSVTGVNSKTPSSANTSGEPEIIVSDRQLRELRAEALEAMVAANTPPRTFTRENSLVDLRSTDDGRFVINNLTDVQLRGQLSDVAAFYVKTEHGLKSCSPPLGLAKDILGHAGAISRFPRLVGITEIPLLRPDGTVLVQPGYDSATRLYHFPAPGLVVPPVPEHPTDDDVRRALELVDDAIGDFPFVYDLNHQLKLVPPDSRNAGEAVISAAKANALAVLLTPIVRPAIMGPTPLALFDAPAPGTGKTLFAEVVSKIATGRDAALFSAPREEEEWRKQLTSYLREGIGVIVIDNVTGKLESGQLSKALTAETWADRLLGFNKNVLVPVRCTWIATGNNIEIGGDLPRRCYWIRLDAQMARPFLRKGFKHPNLRRWVAENRGALITALLTLARAWFAAGKPQLNGVVLGSYEAWAETIGGILGYINVPGFLGNSQQLQEQAEAASDRAPSLLGALWIVTRGKSFTSADIHKLCRADSTASTLIEAMPSEFTELIGLDDSRFERCMGRWLRERVDTRFGESQIHLKRAGVMHNVQLWRVVDPGADQEQRAIQ